ncbi:MAG: DHA2 family efflux MFS transporter permease subunit [Desulfurella sp.]|uniref:DHA2 family efflux MFS transporter permease subunit n=1 Tax=Desulfurella sp. TaxID=1962857 RepID=UPI003D0C81B4
MAQQKVNPYLIALTVMIPTFMVLMDTSIVSVALPYIAGPLSVTPDDAAWTLTVYIAANAIILPVTGFFSQKFGRKKFFLFNVIAFTVSSFLCGIAPNLDLLLIFRALQGFSGGTLQPLSQAILMESFPIEKRTQAMSIFSIGVVFAPILGPLLGGYIVNNYDWRWMFLINVPFGILSTIMIILFIFDPDYAKAKKELKIDYTALSFLVLGIGSLQTMLDRGQEYDWFNSNFIVVLGLMSFFFISMFLIKNYFSKTPLIRMYLLKDKNYAFSAIAMFFLGFLFFTTVALLPNLVQTLLKYDAYTAGLIMMPGGIASLVVIVILGRFSTKINQKIAIFIGSLIVFYALYLMEQINLSASPYFITLGRVIIGFGLPLIFIPINVLAFNFLKKEDINEASSVINFTRNIGGSFGISFMIDTLVQRRWEFHRDTLVSHINSANPIFNSLFEKIRLYLVDRGFSFADSYHKAIALANNTLNAQSLIMSYQDAFHVMMWISLIFIVFLPFIKRVKNKASTPVNLDM